MTLWKTRWRLIALVTLCILSFGGAMIGAQDAPDATAEPTVEVTAEPPIELPPEPTVEVTAEPPTPIPTEATVEVTAEPTVEPTAEPTAEVTAEAPTTEPTATEIPLEPEPPLSPLLIDVFEPATVGNWSLGAGWSLDAAGTLMQAANTADALRLMRPPGVFFNASAQARFQLSAGSVNLSVRENSGLAYTAALYADGQVMLLRAGVPAASAVVAPFTPGVWRDARISAINGTVRVFVDGVEVITWGDSAALPPGGVSIVPAFPPQPTDGSTRVDTLLVDDFVLWVPTSELPLYPTATPTPLPPATAVPETTAEPVVTAEATIEATAEITAEPTVEIDPATGKALTDFVYTGVPSGAPPANDNIASAIVVPGVPYLHEGNTGEATLETDENTSFPPACGGAFLGHTVWFSFTPAETGVYEISTRGTAWDTILAVYTGTAFPQAPLACNDDAPRSLQSFISINLTAATPYYIQLGGYNGNRGEYDFRIQRASLPTPGAPTLVSPPNNDVINAAEAPVDFDWNAPAPPSPDPASYELWLDTDSAFRSPLIMPVTAPTTELPDIDLDDGRWYWKVRALNANGQPGPWSPRWMFTLDTTPPGEPTLRAPANESTVNTNRPTLSWIRVATANRYRVTLFLDGEVTPLVQTETGAVSLALGPGVLPTPLAQGLYRWHVEARDAAGNWGAESDEWVFSVNLARTPAGGSVFPSPTDQAFPTFTWLPYGVAGSQYIVEIAPNLNFAPGETFASNPVSTTSFTLPDDPGSATDGLEYGTWCWRVRVAGVDDPAQMTDDEIANCFIVTPTPPPLLTLLTPLNGVAINDNTPDFTWTPVPDAVPGDPIIYQLQISRTNRFTDLEINETTLTDDLFTPAAPLEDGRWFWRVRAVNTYGAAGPWRMWSFVIDTTAQQRTPRNESFITDTTPTFQWDGVPGAVGYRVILGQQPDLSDGINYAEGNFRLFTPTTPLALGTYYWRVRYSLDGTNFLPGASVIWSFTVTSTPLMPPVITDPPNNRRIGDNTPAIEWSPVVDDPDGSGPNPPNPVSYEYQIARENTFRNIVHSGETSSTMSDPPGEELPDRRYCARVRTLNQYGAPGRWSRVVCFIIDTTPPAPPAFRSPANGSTVADTTPTIVWTRVTGAVRYELRWDTDTNLDDTTNGIETAATSYTPLLQANTWYFQVRAIDAAGNESDWSALLGIKVESPAGIAPVPNRFDTATPQLSWTPISWAVAYEIQIATDSNFNNIVDQNANIDPGTLTYTVGTPLSEGTYYWRVRAKNSGGTSTTWSSTGIFQVEL